jgi:hypothetical protein
MPEQSQRIFGSYRVRLTKTVEAPAKFVYAWCTDFRTDDGKYSSSRPRFRVIHLTPDRIVRIRSSRGKGSRPAVALELIRLLPPNGWHVDQIDESDLATVDYRVTRLGSRRARLTLDITERWMTRRYPTASAYREGTSAYWDRLVASLEERYRSGRPAVG